MRVDAAAWPSARQTMRHRQPNLNTVSTPAGHTTVGTAETPFSVSAVTAGMMVCSQVMTSTSGEVAIQWNASFAARKTGSGMAGKPSAGICIMSQTML